MIGGKYLGTVVLALLVLLMLPSPALSLQGCAVEGPGGYIPDSDCDGTPDRFDNCPSSPNSQQEDMNRNGVGDACDLLIEEILVMPDTHVRSGEFAHLLVRMINNRDRPLQDISAVVENDRLDVREVRGLDFLPAGESAELDFWFRIPKCARAQEYDLTITTRLADGAQVHEIPIVVEQGEACGTADGPLDATIINVVGKVDIDRGQSALIPITITNLGESQATYHLAMGDLGEWGVWRIDPRASVTIPAGHEDAAYLHLQTNGRTKAGTAVLELIITADGQQTRIPIDVYVRAPFRSAAPIWPVILQAGVILLLIALIVAAIIVAVIHLRETGDDKKAPAIERVNEKKIKTNY